MALSYSHVLLGYFKLDQMLSFGEEQNCITRL
jgi:hypothetical protein